jgi:hypothetical protein
VDQAVGAMKSAVLGIVALLVASGAMAAIATRNAESLGESPGGSVDDAGAGDPWSAEYDVLAMSVAGEITLLAFQAPTQGTMNISHRHRLAGPAPGGEYEQCNLDFVLGGYPVSEMLGEAEGEPGPGSGGSMGQGMGSTSPPWSINDVEIDFPSSGSFVSTGGGGGDFTLAAGEWVLFGAGTDGIDLGVVDGASYWSLDVGFPAEMRVEVLAAPLECGKGFHEVPSESSYNLPGVGAHRENGLLEIETTYGSYGHMWTSGSPSGSGTATMHVGATDIDMSAAGSPSAAEFGAGKMSIEVETWEGSGGPSWLLAGLWLPFGDGPPLPV